MSIVKIRQFASMVAVLVGTWSGLHLPAAGKQGPDPDCVAVVRSQLGGLVEPKPGDLERKCKLDIPALEKQCCALGKDEPARDACVSQQRAKCAEARYVRENFNDLSGYEYFIIGGMKFSGEVGRGKNDVASTFADSSAPRFKSEERESWSVSFGYNDKAIVRDTVKLAEAIVGESSGWGKKSLRGDLFIDPFKLTATIGRGDVFKPNAAQPVGMPKDQFDEENSWRVAIKYELPVEHLWGHLIRSWGGRSVTREDTGWKIPK